MHDELVARHSQWSNKIEVQYFSLEGLKTFKSRASSMVNISPGEPIHIIQAGKEWLLNWYFVQDYGVTLFGPPPQTFIDPISKDEFIEAVRQHAQEWRVYVERTRDSSHGQSYAILTLCRALYTTKNGEQVSKQKAALWAAKQIPEWSTLIENALLWRKDPKNNQASFPETQKFVNLIIDKVVGKT